MTPPPSISAPALATTTTHAMCTTTTDDAYAERRAQADALLAIRQALSGIALRRDDDVDDDDDVDAFDSDSDAADEDAGINALLDALDALEDYRARTSGAGASIAQGGGGGGSNASGSSALSKASTTRVKPNANGGAMNKSRVVGGAQGQGQGRVSARHAGDGGSALDAGTMTSKVSNAMKERARKDDKLA